MDHFSDYYFRDSFEHSSSESQLIDNSYRGYDTTTNPSHRSSRSQTPLSHSQVDNKICLPNTIIQQNSQTHIAQTSPSTNTTKKNKKFNIIKAFIPTLCIVTIIIFISTIIILETDIELLNNIKNIPEIISLKYHVYEPIKQYLRNKILF